MPAVLREHQHELSSIDGSTAIVFGTEDTGYLTTSRPTIATGDLRNGDVDRPQEDGIMFGRDYRGSKTLTFEIGVLTDRLSPSTGYFDAHVANLDYLNRLEAMWVNEQWRATSRSLAILRSCEGGRTWRCYGRPRRYDEVAGPMTQMGYTPVVADFALIDDRWYSDAEYATDSSAAPKAEGGLVPPLVAPLVTMQYTSGTTTMQVNGSRSTWPIVEFHGPVLNPTAKIGSVLNIGLTMAIPQGQVITVDTRPWQRTVLRQDGASFAGYLSRDTPVMRNCLLPPGRYALTFGGQDPTGTSWCRVRWREARTRP
jgi:hypothetical protein